MNDTIDPRQQDQTHTGIVAVNDIWNLCSTDELSSSAFVRIYNLALFSNFGEGLIRQSEFRTVEAESRYSHQFASWFELMGGLAYNEDDIRRDNLDHYLSGNAQLFGPFLKVLANNIAIREVAPFVAVHADLGTHLHIYGGLRHESIELNNTDMLKPAQSSDMWRSFESPKATLAWTPGSGSLRWLPSASFSIGQAFFTEDPRISAAQGPAAGTAALSPFERSHSEQLVLEKEAHGTDASLTLGHTSTTATLAKIDPDTGLAEDEGPSTLKFLTASVRHQFDFGMAQATFSKADARDVDIGLPTAEAPRIIFDFLTTLDRLPLRLHGRAEYEYVGHKLLDVGNTDHPAAYEAIPVGETRIALLRCSGIWIPFMMFTRQEHSLERMTAIWLLPIVAAEVSAASGAILAPLLNTDLALRILLISYALWAFSVPLALSILTILLLRLILHKLPPSDMAATGWLALGPIGTGALGLISLGSDSTRILPLAHFADIAQVAFGIGLIGSIALLGYGAFWLAMAILMTAHYLRHGMLFNLGWWGFTFPLGVYAVATLAVARATHVGTLFILGGILVAALTVLWISISVPTIQGAWSGSLFHSPCLMHGARYPRIGSSVLRSCECGAPAYRGFGSRGGSMLPFLVRPGGPKRVRSHRNTVSSQRGEHGSSLRRLVRKRACRWLAWSRGEAAESPTYGLQRRQPCSWPACRRVGPGVQIIVVQVRISVLFDSRRHVRFNAILY